MLDDQFERLAIEDVGRVNHLRRMLRLPWLETGRHRPNRFAGAHAIDDAAVPADQVENSQIRARLLRKTHHIERRQIFQPLNDLRSVVHINRRAELARQRRNRLPSNFGE